MKKQSKKQAISRLYLWVPLAALFLILPFLMRYHVYDSAISKYAWSSGNPQAADISLYCKQQFLTILGGCILILLMWQTVKQREGWKNQSRKYWQILIPAVIYFTLVMVSSLCSKYRTAAFQGSDEQFESCFAVLTYFIIILYLLVNLKEEQDFGIFLKLFGIFAVMTALLGILQYADLNPLNLEFIQRMILPKGYIEDVGKLSSVFEEGRVSLTAYNPNYAGVLITILSAFCVGFIITETTKVKLIGGILLLLLLLVALVGTGSKAGLLVFSAIALFSLFFVRKRLKKYWPITLTCVAIFCIAGILLVFYARLPLLENIKNALSFEQGELNPIKRMTTDEDGIHLTYNDCNFTVRYRVEDGNFYLDMISHDGVMYETAANAETMTYHATNEALKELSFSPAPLGDVGYGLTMHLENHDWTFIFLDDVYYFINNYNRLERLQEVDRYGFYGHEMFATARGLIWSTTLPLLKDHILLGSGANTFVFEYPQSNYKDMYYFVGTNQIVTRPHNMYLQTAVESGVVALLALLVFYGWYLVQSLRLCWKSDFSGLAERLSFACFLAVTAYIVCGLTNDSMITVAPVFWGILGAGIAANRMMMKEKK